MATAFPPPPKQLEGTGALGKEDDDDRPIVLFLSPTRPIFNESFLSHKYRLLSPWEFPDLPFEDLLAAQAASIRAVLSSMLAPVDACTIARLPHLGCVVTTSTGVDHIDLDACRRRGIAVGNCGTIFSEAVAEYAVGMLIDVLRRVSAADRFVRAGLWRTKGDWPLGCRLSGKRVGIIGLGNIGSLIAKILDAFGCKVSYNSRTKKPSVSYQYFPTALELAAHNDILMLSCALTSETRGIVSREVLEALGSHGVLINVGRGALVDEGELVCCLREGVIGGAGLDVFVDEPRVPQELFEMDNVVLSPHCSVLTEETLADNTKITTANLEAFFLGKPLPCPIKL